jgi:hypothetical protein
MKEQISVTDVDELRDIAKDLALEKRETSSNLVENSNKPDSSNPLEVHSSEYRQLKTNDFNLSESGLNVLNNQP